MLAPRTTGQIAARTVKRTTNLGPLAACLSLGLIGWIIVSALVAANAASALGDPTQVSSLRVFHGQTTTLRFAAIFVPYLLLALCVAMANHNARTRGVTGMKHKPFWAFADFFVPLANLFLPLAVVRELWRVSAPPTDPRLGWQHESVPAWINLWWVALLASVILSKVIDRGLTNPTEPSTAMLYAAVGFPLLAALSAGLTIQLVRRLARA